MYWLYGTKKTAAPVIPWYVLGETMELTFSLVVESGEALDKVSLCCIQKAHADWFQAKLSTQDMYMGIGCVLDPTCYLGHLAEGQHQVDFRITIPDTAESKLHTIPILVMHDSGATWPDVTFCGSDDVDRVWATEFEHAPLWQRAYGGCPSFDTGSICIREQKETVTFDGTVQNYMVCRSAVSESGKTFTWTRNGMGIEEMFAVGIATDVENGELTEQGFVTNPDWDWTPDKQLFLHWVSGQMTQDRPSLDNPDALDIICGEAITATKICFKPEYPNVVITALSWVLDGSAIATDGDGTAWFYGGEYSGGTLADVLYSVYVDELGTMGAQVTLTPGGGERRDAVLTYEDGKLYAWSGTNEYGDYVDALYEYDIATDTWTQLTSGGTPRVGADSLVQGGVIYYFGGTNVDGAVTVIDAYTIATDAWSVPDSLPQELIDLLDNDEANEVGTVSLGATATITLTNVPVDGELNLISGGEYDDKLWYIVNGEPDTVEYGHEGEEIHTTFLYYDLLEHTWTQVDTTGGPGACKWGAIAGAYFYAYGRARDIAYDPASLWRFNFLTNTWTELAPNENAASRYYSDADMSVFFTDGTNLYVWGSWDSGDTDYLDTFTVATGAWTQVETAVSLSRYNFCWTVKDGLFYAYGGIAVSGGYIGGAEVEAHLRTIRLSDGVLGAVDASSWDHQDVLGRMSSYSDKFFIFGLQNYEYPYNRVDLFQTDGHHVYVPLTEPAYCANTPINYGYRCYIPTVARDGDNFTITAWSWDMRPSAGYYIVASVVNGQIVYTTTYGDLTQSQVDVYSWDPYAGWSSGGSVGSYVVGTAYTKVIRSTVGSVQIVMSGAPGSQAYYVYNS